jgi:hypothetical protein
MIGIQIDIFNAVENRILEIVFGTYFLRIYVFTAHNQGNSHTSVKLFYNSANFTGHFK